MLFSLCNTRFSCSVAINQLGLAADCLLQTNVSTKPQFPNQFILNQSKCFQSIRLDFQFLFTDLWVESRFMFFNSWTNKCMRPQITIYFAPCPSHWAVFHRTHRKLIVDGILIREFATLNKSLKQIGTNSSVGIRAMKEFIWCVIALFLFSFSACSSYRWVK